MLKDIALSSYEQHAPTACNTNGNDVEIVGSWAGCVIRAKHQLPPRLETKHGNMNCSDGAYWTSGQYHLLAYSHQKLQQLICVHSYGNGGKYATPQNMKAHYNRMTLKIILLASAVLVGLYEAIQPVARKPSLASM